MSAPEVLFAVHSHDRLPVIVCLLGLGVLLLRFIASVDLDGIDVSHSASIAQSRQPSVRRLGEFP